MILYTPLSENDVFPTNETDYTNRQCVSYNGKSCYVEQTENGEYRILQLLSTDPKDFLDMSYTPGNIIK
ncbi:YlzJ-like family protein [Ornithinibacillus halophilus]|uniref:YlzJ-like protein n=1 Tax=Ornithinibacillus halophilus TaxID=930117 RepID=A0A1M5CDR2_9BACI|nr:YlzJ-like family protein [Ornithinibacillus halophilus]SHF52883.1 YlzJ-like protein [Ornithinibacillus halophilus]